ncbi:putative choline kinase involved in LPS biosynthesis, partial [Lachnospiraceae bacterium JC7]
RAYICRIPGPGTEKLINRKQEGEVYKAVTALGITEELVYFNSENGYKISRYYNGARNADYGKPEELSACMTLLKKLHNSGLKLNHEFDFGKELTGYEKDIKDVNAQIPFEDYPLVRMQVSEIMDWLSSLNRPKTIAHIDSVKDNFIFTDEGLRMIDWEYAGMADPLVDLAMAAIYSYMSYDEVKELIKVYAEAPSEVCDDGGIALEALSEDDAFAVVTAYMGMGGLLWSLWGVYKMALGESFGDYTLKMYRYFKDSYKILRKLEKI